jgi:hypothetical protein
MHMTCTETAGDCNNKMDTTWITRNGHKTYIKIDDYKLEETHPRIIWDTH